MNLIFLASAVDEVPAAGLGGTAFPTREQLILCGSILLVVAAVLVGLFLSRRRKRRNKSRGEYRRHSRSFTEDAAKGVAEIKQYVEERKERGGRHHRRRREHRPRNPTLAETGGLPPIRTDAPPPPNPSN
jgi:FtsZ-interacting cell division protein ZipA